MITIISCLCFDFRESNSISSFKYIYRLLRDVVEMIFKLNKWWDVRSFEFINNLIWEFIDVDESEVIEVSL